MRMREQQINPHLFPLAPIDCSNHIMKQQRGSVFPLFNTKVACFATTHGRQTRPKFPMKHRVAKLFACECEAHEDAKLGPSAATDSAGHNAKFEVSFDCRSVCPTDSQQVSSQSQRVRKKLSSCTTIVVRIKVEQSTHTALDRRNNLHAEVWRTLTCSVTSVALHLRDERYRERRHIDQRARHREHGNVSSACALFSIQVCPHHCAATSMIILCGPSTSQHSVIRISSLRNIKCTLREVHRSDTAAKETTEKSKQYRTKLTTRVCRNFAVYHHGKHRIDAAPNHISKNWCGRINSYCFRIARG